MIMKRIELHNTRTLTISTVKVIYHDDDDDDDNDDDDFDDDDDDDFDDECACDDNESTVSNEYGAPITKTWSISSPKIYGWKSGPRKR